MVQAGVTATAGTACESRALQLRGAVTGARLSLGEEKPAAARLRERKQIC